MNQSVKLVPLTGGPSEWKMSLGTASGDKPGHYPPVKLQKDSGAHVITYDIVGQNNVTFAANPIGVSRTAAKPPAGASDPEVPTFTILNNGKQLVVVDWNSEAVGLNYQLYFNNHGPLDPVIQNGGGIKPGFTDTKSYSSAYGSAATYALVAVVAFLLGMLIYRQVFARAR
jgi:hypothetical protein